MNRFALNELAPNRLSMLLSMDGEIQWTETDQAEALKHQLAAELLPDLLLTGDLDAKELETFILKLQGPRSFGAHLSCRTPSLKILGAIKRFGRQVSATPNSPLKGTAGMVLYYAAIAAALVRCNARISSLGKDDLLMGFKWARTQAGADSVGELFQLAISTLTLVLETN